jgi:hypothetical protein
MDVLTTYTHNTEPQLITVSPLISTILKSPQHLLSLLQPAVSSPAVPWQRILQWRSFSFPRSGPLVTAAPAELLSTVNSTIAPSLLSLLCRVQLKYQPSTELDCPNCLLHNSSTRTTSKTPFFYCCVNVRFRGSVFTKPFPRNGRLFIRLVQTNGCTRYLSRGLWLATGLYATIF